MKIISILSRFRSLWLNLLFFAYLGLQQPLILTRLTDAANKNSTDWLMGGLLLGIQAAELLGVLLKRQSSEYYARTFPRQEEKSGFWMSARVVTPLFGLIFHLGLAVMLAIIASDLLGFGSGDNVPAGLQCLMILLVFAVIFKETFFIALVLSGGSSAGLDMPPPQTGFDAWVRKLITPPALKQITFVEAVKDLAGDLLLLVFSALSYTACWEFLISRSPVRNDSHGLLMEYLGVSILFFMVYFSTRITYMMQNMSTHQTRLSRILSAASFVLIWLMSLWMVPVV